MLINWHLRCMMVMGSWLTYRSDVACIIKEGYLLRSNWSIRSTKYQLVTHRLLNCKHQVFNISSNYTRNKKSCIAYEDYWYTLNVYTYYITQYNVQSTDQIQWVWRFSTKLFLHFWDQKTCSGKPSFRKKPFYLSSSKYNPKHSGLMIRSFGNYW